MTHLLKTIMKVRDLRYYDDLFPHGSLAKAYWNVHRPHPTAKTSGAVIRQVFGYTVASFSQRYIAQLFDEVFVDKSYMFRTASRRPVILDCGSNIGMSTLFFKVLYPDCSVTCFEPDRDTFEMLERNIATNRLKDVVAHRTALGNSDNQEVEFFVDPANPGSPRMSLYSDRISRTSQRVPLSRLSRHVNGHIDFAKIDIEGAEQDVLRDLVDSGAIRQIEQVTIEYHHHVAPNDDRLGQVLTMLEEAGFGYQLVAHTPLPAELEAFQDILIVCYRKPLRGQN